MAKKGKAGKTDAQAMRSIGEEAAVEKSMQSFQLKIDKNTILTISISIAAAPVVGKGPRPKKDELLLMLVAALTAMLVGKTPKPKKHRLVFEPVVGTPVISPGRKRVNP